MKLENLVSYVLVPGGYVIGFMLFGAGVFEAFDGRGWISVVDITASAMVVLATYNLRQTIGPEGPHA